MQELNCLDFQGGDYSQLPNWTYSVGVAVYLQAQESSSSSADSLMPGIHAVQLYPSIVVALLEKCAFLLVEKLEHA